jgi:hypothetical protein
MGHQALREGPPLRASRKSNIYHRRKRRGLTPPLRTNLSLESSGGVYPRPLFCRGLRRTGVANVSTFDAYSPPQEDSIFCGLVFPCACSARAPSASNSNISSDSANKLSHFFRIPTPQSIILLKHIDNFVCFLVLICNEANSGLIIKGSRGVE